MKQKMDDQGILLSKEPSSNPKFEGANNQFNLLMVRIKEQAVIIAALL